MEITAINNKHKGWFIKHSPEILQVAGIVSTIQSTMLSAIPTRIAIYKVMYKQTGEKNFLVEYYRLTKPNNWLRIHGYPTRRS